MLIPTDELTLDDLPRADCSDRDLIRFAQSLDGYAAVGGDMADFNSYVDALRDRPRDDLALTDLRILLFATQRAHYFQGGGWPDRPDPLMGEMRHLTDLIRTQLRTNME